MNWGYKILLTIIAFIIITLAMVFVAMKQQNDLIEENYYEKELAYQSLIDASRNLDKLQQADLLFIDKNIIKLKLPVGSFENLTEGSIEILRRDDASKDVILALTPDSSGNQSIPIKFFAKGGYTARIRWSNNGQLFYEEQNIFIN
jgi:hypothetical protein